MYAPSWRWPQGLSHHCHLSPVSEWLQESNGFHLSPWCSSSPFLYRVHVPTPGRSVTATPLLPSPVSFHRSFAYLTFFFFLHYILHKVTQSQLILFLSLPLGLRARIQWTMCPCLVSSLRSFSRYMFGKRENKCKLLEKMKSFLWDVPNTPSKQELAYRKPEDHVLSTAAHFWELTIIWV